MDVLDVLIVGSGPSALSSAIYTTRDGYNTTLYEKSAVGGIVATIDKIDNYPGFPDGITGWDCASLLENQAKKFGARVEFGNVEMLGIDENGRYALVDGEKKYAKAILIATGCSHSKLNIPGEDEYFGHGVSYCATCDGAFFINKKLAVVGGANSAVQEAIYLTQFASHIDLLVRSTIKASDILKKQLDKFVEAGKITIHLNTATKEIIGQDGKVSGVAISNEEKNEIISVDGVFVFVGLKPNSVFLKDSGIDLDSDGFIVTDEKLQTNLAGVFASGDVRSGSTRQIASASGEGVTAAISIREYLNNL